MRLDASRVKVSLLEKVLINWATPLEAVSAPLFYAAGLRPNPKYEPWFEEHGLFLGFWHSKVCDYQRLINAASKGGRVSSKALDLYGGTPCGWSMKIVYKAFR